MSRFHFARAGLLCAAIGSSLLPALVGLAPAAVAQSLRTEIGTPLKAAQELMKARKYKEALAKIRDADAVARKSPAEQLLIDRTRASAAQAAGDYETAAKSFEAALASGKLSPGDTQTIVKTLPSLYFQTRDWPRAIAALNRQLKDYGEDAQARAYLTQAYYQSGDFGKVQKETAAAVQAAEKAGRAPSEEQLQLLANAALRQNDKAGYVSAIEKLVVHYPKPDYWKDLLSRVESRPGFSPRLALDVYRLKLALGQPQRQSDYMEMSQLSLQAAAPAEAIAMINQAYKTKAFGAGAEAAREKRLLDLANKNAAELLQSGAASEAQARKNKDGDGLADLGYAYVAAGKTEQGLALMNDAIKSGTARRIEEIKLHLGVAYLTAGKKAEAIKAFKSVQGKDGTADLARYWLLHTNRGA